MFKIFKKLQEIKTMVRVTEPPIVETFNRKISMDHMVIQVSIHRE